ncbi:MAG: heavy-metal-associated domain-containing protein [Chloroflexi bacterium]|jgi:copper chaperone CopZ|nr:heavy-metal-associated domain-containing protein [Chloroflexota bacterium]
MTKILKLKVVGEHTMHCAGCERSITYTLSQFPGVEEVNADWKTQKIRVDLASDEVDLEKIKAELEWIGYAVEAM